MEYQAKLQEAKLQDTATYQFFLFLGVLHQLLHQQIFSVNLSELIQNYLEVITRIITKMSSKHLSLPPLQQKIARTTKVFY